MRLSTYQTQLHRGTFAVFPNKRRLYGILQILADVLADGDPFCCSFLAQTRRRQHKHLTLAYFLPNRVAEELVSFIVPSRALVRSIPGCIEDQKRLSRSSPFFWRWLVGVDEECSTAE